MKNTISTIIFFLTFISFSSSTAQVREVLLGDTDIIASIGTNDHCRISDFSYTHSNNNFSITPYPNYIGGPPLYWGLNGDVSFTPKSIGIQTDTFLLSGNN